ncbi:hypothetical protein [Longimicrobium sp.]|uniref:hypothetical protein n=1 Tax=Longimicrobium sp. TaxID=2029185 RepID=UPI002E36BF55|nr:hypothetical protein [Longimicrobium sp.]HEX6037704.1 hypothetical protein [Longimicrobium sp.]
MLLVDPRTLPARPPSEVEWEDLLVRVEIAPRALRVAVEDAPAGHPGVTEALHRGVMAEMVLQDMLEAIVEDREARDGVGVEGMEDDPQELVARYARLRFRSFVMVQRRGLNVWDWTVRGGPYAGATAYQLFQGAARMDGMLLDAVRQAARGGPSA